MYKFDKKAGDVITQKGGKTKNYMHKEYIKNIKSANKNLLFN